jgi:hypothetical protein
MQCNELEIGKGRDEFEERPTMFKAAGLVALLVIASSHAALSQNVQNIMKQMGDGQYGADPGSRPYNDDDRWRNRYDDSRGQLPNGGNISIPNGTNPGGMPSDAAIQRALKSQGGVNGMLNGNSADRDSFSNYDERRRYDNFDNSHDERNAQAPGGGKNPLSQGLPAPAR